MVNELAPGSLVRARPSTEPIRCASRWLLPSLGLRGGSLLGGQSPTIRAVVVVSNMIFDSYLREARRLSGWYDDERQAARRLTRLVGALDDMGYEVTLCRKPQPENAPAD